MIVILYLHLIWNYNIKFELGKQPKFIFIYMFFKKKSKILQNT